MGVVSHRLMKLPCDKPMTHHGVPEGLQVCYGVMLLPFELREYFFDFVQFFSQSEEINCIYCERGTSSRILCLLLLMEIKSNVSGVKGV